MDDNLGFEIVKALDCNDMGAAGRFLKKELDYIAETYCNNYATFYHSTVNGGKDKDAIAKNGGSLPGKSKREIVLSSSQQMIADVVERTVLEPSKPKPVEQNGVDDSVVAVDTSFMEVPTAGSSLEVSPPASGHRNASPLHLRKKKRRLSSLREFDDRRQEFDFVREKRRGLEDDMKYARAKLEAVTAERDFWMAKIDVLDLERQFWMREIEKSLNDHY
uniref:BZIP domain-containing protein n=1 Tax=Angiostrongylus cantonensis TaxID=6313 RepID=A0A0K0D9L8_ANGCA